jgi:hypothetical protein
MVCVSIWRKPRVVKRKAAIAIRDALHDAVVKVMRVKKEDVELRIRKIKRDDVNSGLLAVEIISGPGKDNWRAESVRQIRLDIDSFVMERGVIPAKLQKKGKSNGWLLAGGQSAAMPFGCPGDLH